MIKPVGIHRRTADRAVIHPDGGSGRGPFVDDRGAVARTGTACRAVGWIE